MLGLHRHARTHWIINVCTCIPGICGLVASEAPGNNNLYTNMLHASQVRNGTVGQSQTFGKPLHLKGDYMRSLGLDKGSMVEIPAACAQWAINAPPSDRAGTCKDASKTRN
jgi:hypothetical protein